MGILSFSDVALNGGIIAATGASAAQIVAFFGDTSGDRCYSDQDVESILQVVMQVANGFAAYPLTDPRIIADINGDGRVDIGDVQAMINKTLGLPVAWIPVVPSDPPSLHIVPTNNQVVISWPQCVDGFALENSAALGLQANWTTVTNLPVIIGSARTVTLEAGEATRFYRMRKQ